MSDFVPWLRGIAEKGGKGVVDNIDARCLGRVADELARLRAELADRDAKLAVVVGARDLIEGERGKIAGDDGYNYVAGQEYGLRLALIILDKALANLPAGAKAVMEVVEAAISWRAYDMDGRRQSTLADAVDRFCAALSRMGDAR